MKRYKPLFLKEANTSDSILEVISNAASTKLKKEDLKHIGFFVKKDIITIADFDGKLGHFTASIPDYSIKSITGLSIDKFSDEMEKLGAKKFATIQQMRKGI